jgi:DNA-binding transcriptional LysR family regulator
MNAAQRLQDMALFVELFKVNSFSKAAENLGMPASTLSRRMAQFELALGVRLINRTTRKVEATEEGRVYYAKCAPLVEAAMLAHEDLNGALKGTLRISCTHDFGHQYLLPLLPAFSQRYPELMLDIDLSTRRVDLAAEHFDAAIRFGALKDSSLVARKIGAIQLGLYASPAYLREHGTPSTPAELSQHRCIRMNAEGGAIWRLFNSETGQEEPISVSGPLTVNSVALIRQWTIMSQGIGVIDQQLAAADVRQQGLTRILPAWELKSTPLHLVTASRYLPKRVRLFSDFLAANFNP